MKKNKIFICLTICLISNSSLFAPMPPKPPTIGAYPYDWKYASIGETDVQVWRKEMNYWYDQCADFNDDTNDDMPIGEKATFFLSNKKLESKNNLLREELNGFYPELCKKDYYDLGALELEKKLELEQIKDQILFDESKNKKNPEIEKLQERLKELDKDHMILNDLCEKKGYIPSEIDEPLSYVEKRKNELEREYYSMQIDMLEKRVVAQDEIITQQKNKADRIKKACDDCKKARNRSKY